MSFDIMNHSSLGMANYFVLDFCTRLFLDGTKHHFLEERNKKEIKVNSCKYGVVSGLSTSNSDENSAIVSFLRKVILLAVVLAALVKKSLGPITFVLRFSQ